MRFLYLLKSLGYLLRILSAAMFAGCLVPLFFRDYFDVIPYLTASVACLLCGFLFLLAARKVKNLDDIRKVESLSVVALIWIVYGIFCGIPFLFYGFSFLDAVFESISGLTTTGASVIVDYDAYPPSVFFWRAYLHWLGGIGIVVLFVGVLPQFSVAGRQLFFAETTGPTEEKLTPRIRQTASILFSVYGLLTAAQIFLLIVAGMPFFDAVCIAFSTMGTGGFAVYSDGLNAYHSLSVVWIVIVFMFFAGCNLSLVYRLFFVKKRRREVFCNSEFLLYLLVTLLLSAGLFLSLMFNQKMNMKNALTDSVFHIVTLMTTTGFSYSDFEKWDSGSKMFLILAMLTGGCAGSTAGGIKFIRILFLFKLIARELKQMIHPNAVIPIKVNGKPLPDGVSRQMASFILLYFLLFLFGGAVMTVVEGDLAVGLSGSLATLGNIGPGFGAIGPYGTYADLHVLSKLIAVFNMLMGRLELIPFMILIYPEFWIGNRRISWTRYLRRNKTAV